MVTELTELLLAGFKLILGPGADECDGALKQVERLALSAPCSPWAPPSTSQQIPGIGPWHSFHWNN
eukprot:1154183-Pelagomonas_calceolata.AAC.9